MKGAFNVRFKHATRLEPWGKGWRSHISAEIYGRNLTTSPALYVPELLKWTNCSPKMWSWALRKRNHFITLGDGNKSVFLRHRNTHSQTDMTTGDLTFSTTLRDNVSLIQTKRAVSWIFSKIGLVLSRSLSFYCLSDTVRWNPMPLQGYQHTYTFRIHWSKSLMLNLNIMESLSWMREA